MELLNFRGAITFNEVERLLRPIGSKQLYHVLLECLQNIAYHAAEKEAEVIVRSEGNAYKIRTVNRISNSDAERLKAILDNINNLTPEELTDSYKRLLVNRQFSDKGTAGLGLIDIARKSGRKLKYDIKRIDDRYSNFSFSVDVLFTFQSCRRTFLRRSPAVISDNQ